ncbi:LacI family transcriptional regulator [Paenibacillus sp. V4I3]|uniref:LacI family DNA-binding transcriptional regulator n=1 Tax=unclassified Paenibacillus TaxID=185978 RepID=UPI0027804888|nr:MULTISPECIES: LacI family DNA-binding transcriptional regulator [unclassified Paenibacillus]MDQ0874442.1 LacI family transcriptional regulator [Paenibacillus sp. V4I3]MDQ0886299.1 LacI family transcriptional regulator [Paenibacillus sp. V4I9]
MSKEKITIQHIADSLGLSRNTVSKALNGSDNIPAETRNKVLKRAIELNYKQFALIDTDTLNTKNTGNIALLTSNMPSNSHFGASSLSGLEKKISSDGFNLSIHIVRESDISSLVLPNNFDTNKVDGIVCIELFDKKYTQLINSLGIPSIFIDSTADIFYPELHADIILMENEQSSYYMTKKLIDNGYASVGFIGDYNHCKSFNERWAGFNRALLDSHLQLDPLFCIVEEDRYIADPKWLENRLDNMKNLPSAFVCTNDFIAINVMRILKNKNVRIPEDIVICGFDNSPESQIVEPHLTTVHIFRDEIGVLAGEILLSRVENPLKPPQITHVQTKPIFRESTGNLNES